MPMKMSSADLPPKAKAVPPLGVVKPRRVRTGCLTCRERHLKCDEATPDCRNCVKSHRVCRRGLKLNFLEITTQRLSEVPPRVCWEVDFYDESLNIASEYEDGLSRYNVQGTRRGTRQTAKQIQTFQPKKIRQAILPISSGSKPGIEPHCQPFSQRHPKGVNPAFGNHEQHSAPSRNETSPLARDGGDRISDERVGQGTGTWPWWSPSNDFDAAVAQIATARAFEGEKSSTASNAPQATHAPSRSGSPRFEGGAQLPATPPEDNLQCSRHSPREYLHEIEEVAYMEVFVNEVGVWMDCFDAAQNFSQQVPFKALKTPMLLNALLACGVLHLSMADSEHYQTASIYYDTATSQLLRNLQNPERNTEECATAAVVLNVYEAMTDKPPHRMSHVAGARALIKECGWSAASSGIGSTCFWLNVGMEVLDCLATKRPTTWDPNEWGVDMEFGSEADDEDDNMGGEDLWVHRMFYILANIANFRASSPPYQDMSPHAEQMERSSRLCDWQKMKRMCDKWNNGCPRSMHPMGYLEPSSSRSESCFPKIWLIKRPALLGRLLYHMGQCILAQTNPLEPPGTSKEMTMLQLHHAQQICGIVAHSRERSMWTVAVRSVEIAAPSLVDLQEQDESLRILDRMNTRGSQWLRDVVSKLNRGWDQERIRRNAQPICSPISESNHHHQGGDDHGTMLANFMNGPPGVPLMHSRTLSTHSGISMPRTMELDPSPLMSRDLMEALRSADFRHPEHPYKNFWQPASRVGSITEYQDNLVGITERDLESLSQHVP